MPEKQILLETLNESDIKARRRTGFRELISFLKNPAGFFNHGEDEASIQQHDQANSP